VPKPSWVMVSIGIHPLNVPVMEIILSGNVSNILEQTHYKICIPNHCGIDSNHCSKQMLFYNCRGLA
jgi:hypothetical protein